VTLPPSSNGTMVDVAPVVASNPSAPITDPTAEAATGAVGDGSDGVELVVLVKWNKTTYPVELPRSSPLSALTNLLWELTEVRPERQKLLGLTRAPGGSGPDVPLAAVITKPEQKVMMMGSREADIAAINTKAAAVAAANEVQDDFDIDYGAFGAAAPAGSGGAGVDGQPYRGVRIHNVAAVEEKLRRRVANTKIKLMHPLRSGRKCLVLDIDYTIYDCKGIAAVVADLGRPGLHQFMAAAYRHYDIVMWSQTNWRYLEAKLTELCVWGAYRRVGW